jgi:hypothetical protein
MLDACFTETRTNSQIAIPATNIEGARFNSRGKNNAPRPEVDVAGGSCFLVAFRTKSLCFFNGFDYDEDNKKSMNCSYFKNSLEGVR